MPHICWLCDGSGCMLNACLFKPPSVPSRCEACQVPRQRTLRYRVLGVVVLKPVIWNILWTRQQDPAVVYYTVEATVWFKKKCAVCNILDNTLIKNCGTMFEMLQNHCREFRSLNIQNGEASYLGFRETHYAKICNLWRNTRVFVWNRKFRTNFGPKTLGRCSSGQ